MAETGSIVGKGTKDERIVWTKVFDPLDPTATLFTPPTNITVRDHTMPSVFLAGTIDMGNSVDWQREAGDFFIGKGFNVFNPRRANWDSSWKQSIETPEFYQQVRWETNALHTADCILFHFVETSMSPITMLELGMFLTSGKIAVNCPKGFYRKGNIDIMCNEYNVPLFEEEHPVSAAKYLVNNFKSTTKCL